jgi:hypothetical protein
MHRLVLASLVLGWILFLGVDAASAQPSGRTPPLGPYFPSSTINGFPDPNSRVRPSPNQVGLQSADIYAKNGYPKMLGDAVEQGTSSGSSGGGSTVGTIGQSGQFGGGFQGNTGNQIGQNSGGTIFGGIFGGGGGGGGGGQTVGGGLINRGVTGGGFSGGMMPKGFGFGGTPDFTKSWAPVNGGPNK